MHVNEVTRTGVDLAHRAAEEWDVQVDLEEMISILALHDVDKPLLYRREDGGVKSSAVWRPSCRTG